MGASSFVGQELSYPLVPNLGFSSTMPLNSSRSSLELKVPPHAMSFTLALLNIACLEIVHQKSGIFVIMLFH